MINLDEKLVGVRTVGISGHVKPDGDCVGSTLAVFNYISTYYPEIAVDIYLERIPDVFEFLQNADKIKQDATEDKQFDLFIALDCGDAGRLGNNARFFEITGTNVIIKNFIFKNGYFEFGGSTIVVLLEKDKAVIDKDILYNTARGLETRVLMGERIGYKKNK